MKRRSVENFEAIRAYIARSSERYAALHVVGSGTVHILTVFHGARLFPLP